MYVPGRATILTAVALGAPPDMNPLEVALADIGSYSSTETLAVASPIAATGIPETGVIVLTNIHL